MNVIESETEATRLYNALWEWRRILRARQGRRLDIDQEYAWAYRTTWGLKSWLIFHGKTSDLFLE